MNDTDAAMLDRLHSRHCHTFLVVLAALLLLHVMRRHIVYCMFFFLFIVGPILWGHSDPLCHALSLLSLLLWTSMRRRRATVAACDSSDTWWMAMRQLAEANAPNSFQMLLVGPIPWGHNGPLCHALSSLPLLSLFWCCCGHRCSGGVRQWRRATVTTPGEWQCKTGGMRRLAVENGPNIFQMLLVCRSKMYLQRNLNN